jgi:hypothetical protein
MKTKSKGKAQAAMEFLMTYGWAILIVIAVVAALFAMGVFKIGGSTIACSPCFANFAYVDYSAGTIVLKNGPQAISGLGVTGGTTPGITAYNPGATITIAGISTTGDVTVQLNYTITASGLTHTDTATIHNS